MKVLVAYYSRTGVTRVVAEALAGELGADIEPLCDLKDRSGLVGYLSACMDAVLKRPTRIGPVQRNSASYDLIAVGTPVWAFTMAPAVRTYLIQHTQNSKNMAFFCTMGGSGAERTFRHMSELAGRGPKAVMALLERDVRSGAFAVAVKEFVSKLTANV